MGGDKIGTLGLIDKDDIVEVKNDIVEAFQIGKGLQDLKRYLGMDMNRLENVVKEC